MIQLFWLGQFNSLISYTKGLISLTIQWAHMAVKMTQTKVGIWWFTNSFVSMNIAYGNKVIICWFLETKYKERICREKLNEVAEEDDKINNYG